MSRPNISYPTPIPGPSSSFTPPHHQTHTSSRPSLDPSPMPSSSSAEFRRPSGSGSGSTSAGASVHGHRSSSSTSRTPGSLDSHITRLLVTTKQMLQGLDSWSQGNLDEDGVSDIYVRLGNGFETCTAAFQRAGIVTADLESIPNDLRLCLEACLSEEPSQETLNVFLPNIRTIIYNLLNGLKQKQAAYKQVLNERQAAQAQPQTQPRPVAAGPSVPQLESAVQKTAPRTEPALEPRLSARSASSAVSQNSAGGSPASISSQLPATKIPSSQALADRARAGGPQVSRPPPPDAFRPPRRVSENTRQSVSPAPGDQPQLIRHQLSDNPVPPPLPIITTVPAPPAKANSYSDRFSRDSFGDPRPISRFSLDSEITNGSPISSSPPRPLLPLPETTDAETTPTPMNPPLLPTLNLPSAGLRLSDPPVAEPQISSLPDVPPETRATLAALGRSDALERRASKRFSSYTFNKLPGSPNHKKAASIGSPQRPMRRADRPPPMPPLPESLANANLAVTSDGARTPSPTVPTLSLPNGVDHETGLSSSPGSSRTDSSNNSNEGSVRIIKTPELLPIDTAQSTPRPAEPTTASPNGSFQSQALAVFLQIGRQVKKANLELPVTLSSLRLLFMERFEYDPGMEDFPDVYIRDNTTGVQFELEDMDDLREGCVLSLNIEPLDQVKQHFDLTFASMMQELKEMKSSIDLSRRISMTPAPSLLSVSPSSHFNRAAPVAKPEPSPNASPTNTVRTTVPRDVDLRVQQDEIQSLRRDLAVVRQIHVDFLSETKEVFAKLRKENTNMRELVKTKMGGSRALLDNSKVKLEALCADTIQAVEEISDTIDMAREDAFKRFVTPSRTKMEKIRADLKKAHDMVDAFTQEVQSVEPTWRATWHFELSRVMDEQRLLPHQSKLTIDLKQDVKDAEDMLQNVSDFVDQRAANVSKGLVKGFRPPSPEANGGIPNLLMEIRTKEADPNQRLRAIEAQQKAREKEKAMNNTDEFGDELAGFVTGRKLKKTGGTEEVDRQRQRKQEITLKKMLTGDSVGSPTGLLSPQTTGMSSILSPQNTGATVNGYATPAGRTSRGSVKSETGDT